MKIRVLELSLREAVQAPGTRDVTSKLTAERHKLEAYVDEHGIRIPGVGAEFRLIPWTSVIECNRCVVEHELPTSPSGHGHAGGPKRAA